MKPNTTLSTNPYRYRFINFFRIVASLYFIYISYSIEITTFLYFSLAHLLFSVLWLAITEFKLIHETGMLAGIMAQTLDIFLVTIFVMLTGHVNSFVVMGYVIITVLSSLNPEYNFGKIAAINSTLFFLISGFLIYKGYLPMTNIFGYLSSVSLKGLMVATVLLFVSLILTNRIIYPLVKLVHNK